MDDTYILDNEGNPVAVDFNKWVMWYEKAQGKRHVGRDKIGDVEVSTVFLSINHNWGDGPPLLYETMIFGGELDGEQWRYATKEEAEKGHAAAVALVKTEAE